MTTDHNTRRDGFRNTAPYGFFILTALTALTLIWPIGNLDTDSPAFWVGMILNVAASIGLLSLSMRHDLHGRRRQR